MKGFDCRRCLSDAISVEWLVASGLPDSIVGTWFSMTYREGSTWGVLLVFEGEDEADGTRWWQGQGWWWRWRQQRERERWGWWWWWAGRGRGWWRRPWWMEHACPCSSYNCILSLAYCYLSFLVSKRYPHLDPPEENMAGFWLNPPRGQQTFYCKLPDSEILQPWGDFFFPTKVGHRPEKTADAVAGMLPVFNAPYDSVGNPGNPSVNLQKRNQTTWLGKNVRKKRSVWLENMIQNVWFVGYLIRVWIYIYRYVKKGFVCRGLWDGHPNQGLQQDRHETRTSQQISKIHGIKSLVSFWSGWIPRWTWSF